MKNWLSYRVRSIGKKHYRVMKKLNFLKKFIFCLAILMVNVIKNIKEIKKINPDAVIC